MARALRESLSPIRPSIDRGNPHHGGGSGSRSPPHTHRRVHTGATCKPGGLRTDCSTNHNLRISVLFPGRKLGRVRSTALEQDYFLLEELKLVARK